MADYQCPNCAGTNLRVVVTLIAQLIQEDDGNLQTVIVDSDHEWNGDSAMFCVSCDDEIWPAKIFETARQTEEN